MPIQRLDHVNLRTTQLTRMIAWYEDILGVMNGPRPAFGNIGAWLYIGDIPAVHITEVAAEPMGAEHDLKLEHFALSATDRAGFEAKLVAAGERFEAVEVADANIVQINIWDPDGNHIHVDFALDD